MIPVAVLDMLVSGDGRKPLIASLFAGPLSVFLDGRFSIFSGLWSPDALIVLYLVPMVLGGLLGAGHRRRLADSLVPIGIWGRSGN